MIAIGVGILSNYIIKNPSKFTKLIIEIIVWTF